MLENTTFWKLDLFLSSGEGRETSTLLGPLERSNLNQWTWLYDQQNRVSSVPTSDSKKFIFSLSKHILDSVHRSEFQILENTMFRKLDLFPTPTLMGPLERANLNHWTWVKY
jgi:hypothetical protein